MMSDLTKAEFKDKNNTSGMSDDTEEMTYSAAKVFEDPQFYPYLMATRLANKARKRTRILGTDPDEVQDQQRNYQDLVEVFYPSIKRFARYKASRSRLDADEWEGIAGVDLASSASNFYWETMVIDPQWTVARFLKTVYRSIQDPMLDTFDTHTLEVSTEAMGRYRSTHNTEAEVLQNLSEQSIEALIRAQGKQAVEVLNMKIFDALSCPQIAKKLGLSESGVIGIVNRFRAALREKAEGGDPNVPSVPKKDFQKTPFWDNLFGNIDKYRAQFKQRGDMLTPFRRLMVEKFFQLQTGDRDTTIQAVWQSFQEVGWDITKDTVRRAIAAGINLIDFRERQDGRVHGQLLVGWSRHQQAGLVAQVAQDPNIWDTLPEQRRKVLEEYFIEDKGGQITMKSIAEKLGLHESTVSRQISRGIRDIIRIRGSIQYRGELADKPRNLLPT